MVESIVTRLHPTLHTFVLQRLLQGETPSPENIARACERLYTELRPYIDVMVIFFFFFVMIKKRFEFKYFLFGFFFVL